MSKAAKPKKKVPTLAKAIPSPENLFKVPLGNSFNPDKLVEVSLVEYLKVRNRIYRNAKIHEARGNAKTYWTYRLENLDRLNPNFKGMPQVEIIEDISEKPKLRLSYYKT